MLKALPFIIILFFGCVSVRIPDADKSHVERYVLNKGTKYRIGVNDLLVYRLFKFKSNIGIDSTATLSVKQMDDNSIEFELNNEGKIVKRAMKGHFIEEEFKLKRQTQIRLLPPIVWTFRNDVYSIVSSSAGQLIIYNNSGGLMLLTLMPVMGTSSGQEKFTFEAVN